MNNNPPLVSVCLITYNHSNYVKQAIEGVLMQKVNFSWELIIADDFSTDGTRDIIFDYQKKYPDYIKLILQDKNVGALQNWLDLITTPEAKYIAYFEADDFWTDSMKLQKQIDFLESNEEYSACFTNATVLNEIDNTSHLYVTSLSEGDVSLERIIKIGGGLYPTASLIFRTDAIKSNIFKQLFADMSGDTSLIIAAGMCGKVFFLNQVTTVYRRWAGGIYSKISGNPQSIANWKLSRIRGLKKLQKLSDRNLSKIIKQKISSESLYILQNSSTLNRFVYLFNLTTSDFKILLISFKTRIAKLLARFIRFFSKR